MSRIVTVVFLLLLGACSTVQGAGQDLKDSATWVKCKMSTCDWELLEQEAGATAEAPFGRRGHIHDIIAHSWDREGRE